MKKRIVVGQPPNLGGENYLTRKEVAARFGVDPRTIDNWRFKYDMPHYCVGGQVRFKESEVEAWATTMRRGKLVPGMV
jgi:excisionase family DNA binding protein